MTICCLGAQSSLHKRIVYSSSGKLCTSASVNLVSGRTKTQFHRSSPVASQTGRVQFSSTLNTDIPLRERYGVSFEHYLQEKKRVLRAFFPDEERSEELDDDTWRIYMLPVGFFFLSVRPVVDMNLVLSDKPATPNSTKYLSLKAVKWELRGARIKKEDFILDVNGELYMEISGLSKKLRGKMELSVDLAVPDALSLLPSATIEVVGKSLLNQLLESMKDKVNDRVLEDYAQYAWEKTRELSRAPLQ